VIFRDARTHWLLAIYAASTLAVISVVLLTGGNGTAAIVPPQNPSANIYPNQEYNGPCAGLSPAAAACPVGLSALDSDRQVEGIVPMSLPTTFSSLTPQEQGFVLTNLERVDRGQAPIEGLASSLDSLAQSGAKMVKIHRFRPIPGQEDLSWRGATYSQPMNCGCMRMGGAAQAL